MVSGLLSLRVGTKKLATIITDVPIDFNEEFLLYRGPDKDLLKPIFDDLEFKAIAAIGEPEVVDTRNEPRLSRIFSNRIIRRYPAFQEFFGLEDVIGQVVAFFKHAAQGLVIGHQQVIT